MKRFVEVFVPGSRPCRYLLNDKPVTLGNGRAAAIVVKHAKQLKEQHLELTPTNDGCRVSLCPGIESPLWYNGQAGETHLVPWGHDAFLEGVRLSLLEGEAQKYSGLILVMLALLALPVAFFAMKDLGNVVQTAKTIPEAPPLLKEVAVPCNQTDPEMAAHRADRALLGAQAKVARYPFQATDGIDALSLFSEARSCYEQAGRSDEAARVQSDSERWRERLEQEYQGHQLRLRLALENDAPAQALPEISKLKALLAQVELHPYVSWLGAVERRLKQRKK